MRDPAFRPQDLGIGHLFERVRDAVIVADVQTGRIVLWNPAATEIFGYSVSEALEMKVEELVPERLRERHRAGLARFCETGRGPYVDSRELLELPAMRNTGEEIRIEMSLSPIEPTRDIGDEERRYALAVVRDITARKSTEEALRESEARFHALVENALDIVMVTDDQGAIRYVSPSIEWVLGYRSEEMVGTSTAEYVHPDDLERALGELAEAVSRPGVHPVAVETRVRHKDGSWRYLEGIANNLLDDLVVGGIVFNHRDVTERKQAEEEVRRLNEELENRVKERTARLEATVAELRASEERHRLLVDNVEDYAIFMVDPNGHVLDWNVGAERIFGYREAEIVGEPISILFTPEDIRGGAPEWELRKAEKEGRAVDERWHMRKDGSRFWASGFVRPIRDDAGYLRGFAKIARDITDRKRAEEALSQSEERYRAVVKQSTEGIYLVDGDTKGILETNPALQNMLGYTAEELRGMELHEIVAHDRKSVEANVERTLKEGKRFIRDRLYRCKDGSVVEVEVAANCRTSPTPQRLWNSSALRPKARA
jgi:PAS domain S-box-containing protein